MFKRLFIAIILLGAVAGGVVWFNLFRDKMIADFFANQPVVPNTVSTAEAQPGPWTPAIEAIGTVNAAQGVELTVETAGIVKQILFTSNAQVAAGQLLLQLDDVVQRADLEAARTQYALNRQTLERARELVGRGVSSSVSLEQSEAAATASEAQVKKLEAVVEQRQLMAPFAGTIGLPRVDLGQYVAPGTIVATLQDLSTMRVDFSLPEQELPFLRIDQPIEVRIEGLDQAFRGAISGIDPRVDPSSRMVAIRGTIENPEGRLTPGQFVRIRVELPQEEGVIALPLTVLLASLYGDHVYVARPKADTPDMLEARQVFVTSGRRTGGRVEIVSGVAPGDQVITAGQNRLFNGAPVAIDNTVNPAVQATEAK
ncbi:efflux RND transporter periplasmic adaptor subunit [Ruixingdingia sedimenti]|uniref:Efflux RND transporter periplasmic adaptor subunit n=1 Tax=Ruixingdingia sedimenti TaxID=3073604 RepID=A0ABU1F8M1_9RHOB|nr:efflux RND transporter periplasmic adaptor subunit [Xinfangfangia sp. LG-4]MDR5653221.1 efflux RND transporter periplasmic adaptor subunit [Xinfangfangia sp. LG-4]